MGNSNYDITAVINLHNEGYLSYPTIRSAVQAVEHAKKSHSLNSEILLILDNPDEETIKVASRFKDLDFVRLLPVDVKDLALSRNEAVNNCRSEYISFLDGDDLWGRDWLWRCYKADRKLKTSEQVWHPETNIIFDREYHIFHHTDMDSKEFLMDYLRINNYWTALSFGKTEIYRKVPFEANQIKNGFGFEDWNWNCRSIETGIKHKVALETCHFIRRKKQGSMLQDTNNNFCIVTPHNLFKHA